MTAMSREPIRRTFQSLVVKDIPRMCESMAAQPADPDLGLPEGLQISSFVQSSSADVGLNEMMAKVDDISIP